MKGINTPTGNASASPSSVAGAKKGRLESKKYGASVVAVNAGAANAVIASATNANAEDVSAAKGSAVDAKTKKQAEGEALEAQVVIVVEIKPKKKKLR